MMIYAHHNRKLDLFLSNNFYAACIVYTLIGSLFLAIFFSWVFKCTAGRRFEKIFYEEPNSDKLQQAISETDKEQFNEDKKNKEERLSDYIDLTAHFKKNKEKCTQKYTKYDKYDFPENVSKFEYLIAKLYAFFMMTFGISLIPGTILIFYGIFFG